MQTAVVHVVFVLLDQLAAQSFPASQADGHAVDSAQMPTQPDWLLAFLVSHKITADRCLGYQAEHDMQHLCALQLVHNSLLKGTHAECFCKWVQHKQSSDMSLSRCHVTCIPVG